MTTLSVPEPSLSSRAMLSVLSISIWSGRKHDPEASVEIAQRHGAQADAGRYPSALGHHKLPRRGLQDNKRAGDNERACRRWFWARPPISGRNSFQLGETALLT
jgi:hypothetical protein